MKFPKVGEKFYWKNLDSEIVESTCFKIVEEDNIDLETRFFISISKNGGGTFITESDIIDSNSDEVKKFKKEQAEKKVKEVIDYLNQEDIRKILMAKLINEYDWLEADKILDILTNKLIDCGEKIYLERKRYIELLNELIGKFYYEICGIDDLKLEYSSDYKNFDKDKLKYDYFTELLNLENGTPSHDCLSDIFVRIDSKKL